MLQFICLLFALHISPPDKWVTFKDTLGRYTIEYPANWEQTYVQGASGFVSPYENDSDDFRENVNVMVQNLSAKPLTLAEYTAVTRKQYMDAYGAKAIISLKDTNVCGIPAEAGVFTITYGDKPIKLEQYFFVKKLSAYVITFTAAPKQYEKYRPIAEKVMKSFKLISGR